MFNAGIILALCPLNDKHTLSFQSHMSHMKAKQFSLYEMK